MKTKVFGYSRVSTKEQDETGYSLEAQIKLLKEYAGKNEFELVKVFRVTETASKYYIRKTLIEMLEYADKSSVEIILCEKVDRLTRNTKDAAIIDDWVRAKEGRAVHFIKENFILTKNTRAHENLVWDMKVAIARFYANNLSEEVRKGQKEKISQGWLPTKPPIGYKTIGEKGHKIHVIDPEKAPFIKKIFTLYSTGHYSIKALCKFMYEEGFRARSGKQVVKSHVERILKDPFYYGAMRWLGEVVPGGEHEPLISKDLFDNVQVLLKSKTTPKYRKHQFAFKKMFDCGECGGTVTGELQKGHIYYHCNHYRNCTQKRFTTEEEIEKQVKNVFQLFERITPDEAEQIKEKIKANHAEEIAYKENALNELNLRYSSLQKRLDRLYDDRLDERISPEMWDRKQAEINDQQASVREQLEKIKSQETRYFEIWLNIIDLARRAREIYERTSRSPMERRLLLSHIFSNMTLKDQNVAYNLVDPVDKLSKRVEKELEAEKIFENEKTLTKSMRKGSSDTKNNILLRG